jgi:hypothetical protein
MRHNETHNTTADVVATVATLTPWEIRERLARIFTPFTVGSAYGNQRAERDGGAVTVVHGLSVRSNTHANGGEVVGALNDAHRDAVTMTAAAAGMTRGALLRGLVAREIVAGSSAGYRDNVATLPEDVAEILAALLGDAMRVDANAPVVAGRWPFYGWRDIEDDADALADLVAAAVMLSDEIGGGVA